MKSKGTDTPLAVITGGTAGIGRATARMFSGKGYNIGVIARDKGRLDQTVKEIEGMGQRAVGVSADVACADEIKKAAEVITGELGPVDVWVNNAMATVFSEVKDITPGEFKRVTEVTYLGQVYGTMIALKHMVPRNKGVIVSVGSALAYRGIPLQAAYCGAKFATRGFFDSLRVELQHKKKNIHLTMVQLPAHNTPQFNWSKTHINKQPQPVPPVYQPELAAEAIFWASQHKRREVWVAESAVATILVNKIFPGLVDHYLELTAYQSQKTDQTISTGRPDNLFTPVEGNYAAHGIFDKKSLEESLQFRFEKIPLLHYFTDAAFAIIQAAKMTGSYQKALKKRYRQIGYEALISIVKWGTKLQRAFTP